MALKEIELRPGWFIYRCESGGFEHPSMAVKKQFLGARSSQANKNEATRQKSLAQQDFSAPC